jgi:micrococcal nuclease
VERAVDGDTLVLAGGEQVRLIGVDTPETKHPDKPVERFGHEAWKFTRRLSVGKTVRLEFDPANGYRGHRDGYGRLLAYVFLPDGKLLNLEIIRNGYGFAYTAFPFVRMKEFRAAQKEARLHRRGLWSD